MPYALSKPCKVFNVVPGPKILGIIVENSMMILSDIKLSTMYYKYNI